MLVPAARFAVPAVVPGGICCPDTAAALIHLTVVDVLNGDGGAILNDGDICGPIAQGSEAGAVAVRHVGDVQLDGGNRLGAVHAMHERVTRGVYVIGHSGGLESHAVGDRVFGRVGVVIPLGREKVVGILVFYVLTTSLSNYSRMKRKGVILSRAYLPSGIKRCPSEVIGALPWGRWHCRSDWQRIAGAPAAVDSRRLWVPVRSPGDGCQNRYAAARICPGERHEVPRPVWRLDQTTLLRRSTFG